MNQNHPRFATYNDPFENFSETQSTLASYDAAQNHRYDEIEQELAIYGIIEPSAQLSAGTVPHLQLVTPTEPSAQLLSPGTAPHPQLVPPVSG